MVNKESAKQLGKEKSKLVQTLKSILPKRPTSLLPIGLGINSAIDLANRSPKYGGMRGEGTEIKEKYILSGIVVELCRDGATALGFYGGALEGDITKGIFLASLAYLSLTYIADAAGFGGAHFDLDDEEQNKKN